MNSAPTIMVSSTFYDLRQIRKDLETFISKELGYIPLLSEMPSFPVDPDLDTIENCKRKVEENADIMVLVIGGRYGSIDSKTDKSITNLEFLTARAKGIPIYAFVDKSVLNLLPIWESNPTADFSRSTDTPRIFEFIRQVRSHERIWTFDFETAQDIISSLRTQLAYLMKESLKARRLLSGTGTPPFMEALRPKAFRLALEQPEAWEYRLLFQSWLDELEKRKGLIREYRAGLKLQSSIFVPAYEALNWFQTKMRELENFGGTITSIISTSVNEAIGAPGEPGDAEQIVSVTQTIARLLEQALRWALEIRCARVEEPFKEVASELSLMADDLINQIINYPKEGLRQLEERLLAKKPDDPPLNLTFVISTNPDGLLAALEKAKRSLGL